MPDDLQQRLSARLTDHSDSCKTGTETVASSRTVRKDATMHLTDDPGTPALDPGESNFVPAVDETMKSISGHCDQCGINCQDCLLDEYKQWVRDLQRQIVNDRKAIVAATQAPDASDGMDILDDVVKGWQR